VRLQFPTLPAASWPTMSGLTAFLHSSVVIASVRDAYTRDGGDAPEVWRCWRGLDRDARAIGLLAAIFALAQTGRAALARDLHGRVTICVSSSHDSDPFGSFLAECASSPTMLADVVAGAKSNLILNVSGNAPGSLGPWEPQAGLAVASAYVALHELEDTDNIARHKGWCELVEATEVTVYRALRRPFERAWDTLMSRRPRMPSSFDLT
jgi:hypothetical protein